MISNKIRKQIINSLVAGNDQLADKLYQDAVRNIEQVSEGQFHELKHSILIDAGRSFKTSENYNKDCAICNCQ